MENPKVLVSILNWNAPESTIKTVQSVLLSNYDNHTILLLDNNSADNSAEILGNTFPGIQLIKNKKNLGYAGAHKIAATIAMKQNYDLLWILNNDVEVFQDSLGELVNAYSRKGHSLFGSLTINTDGLTINSAGGLEMIDESKADEKSGYNIFGGKKIGEVQMKERPVSGVQGSSLLIPVDIIRKYGFMKTRFFLYGEETEYCYRLREEYRIQTISVPASRVIHHGGRSFSKNEKLKWIRVYYSTRNNNIVLKKYIKDYDKSAMNFRRLPHYMRYFFKHAFLTSRKMKDFNYWMNYYKELGDLHSFLKITGKYLHPEKLLNGNQSNNFIRTKYQ